MNRLLALLSTANFIAAGVFFLLGSLQPAVSSGTSVAGAEGAEEVVMEQGREDAASARNGPSSAEAELRAAPRAVTEIDSAADSVSPDQRKDRSRAVAETRAGDRPELGARSLPVISRDRETRAMADLAGQSPETTASAMRGEDVAVDEPERVPPAPEVWETLGSDQADQNRQAERAGQAGPTAAPDSPDSPDSSPAQAAHAGAEHLEEIFILSEDSYSPGEYLLSGEALRRIDLIAGRAAQGGFRIMVEGHADSVPVADNQRVKYSNNQELSLLRASVVAERLIVSGIAPSRITVLGHGDSRPVASNLTPEGRALNRRVEVKLVPEGGPAMAKVSTPTAFAE